MTINLIHRFTDNNRNKAKKSMCVCVYGFFQDVLFLINNWVKILTNECFYFFLNLSEVNIPKVEFVCLF